MGNEGGRKCQLNVLVDKTEDNRHNMFIVAGIATLACSYAARPQVGFFAVREGGVRCLLKLNLYNRKYFGAALGLGGYPANSSLSCAMNGMDIAVGPYGVYLIAYSIKTDHVAVAHFLHSAQDYEAILFPKS